MLQAVLAAGAARDDVGAPSGGQGDVRDPAWEVLDVDAIFREQRNLGALKTRTLFLPRASWVV